MRVSAFCCMIKIESFLLISKIFSCDLLANSGDPDQIPGFVSSDLGLHCLYMSPQKVR